MDRVNQRLQRSAWLTRTVWMVVLLLATAPMALAQSDSSNRDMATDNVLVTVRIGKMENAKRIPIKSFELIVAPGTPGSKLLSGQRVPIPTGGADGAITYQNIGFVANVAAWLVDKDAIRIVADIEDSRLVAGVDGAAPTIETRQLTVNTTLTPGKPLDLVHASAVDDLEGYVQMEVELLE